MSKQTQFVIEEWEEFYACDGDYVRLPRRRVMTGTRRACERLIREFILGKRSRALIPRGEHYFVDRDEQCAYYWTIQLERETSQ